MPRRRNNHSRTNGSSRGSRTGRQKLKNPFSGFFDRAKLSFATTTLAMPALVARDGEMAAVKNCVTRRLNEEQYGTVYILGARGSGKTAAMIDLFLGTNNRDLPSHRFHFLDFSDGLIGMYRFYTEFGIAASMGTKNYRLPAHLRKEKRFADEPPLVLVIDGLEHVRKWLRSPETLALWSLSSIGRVVTIILDTGRYASSLMPLTRAGPNRNRNDELFDFHDYNKHDLCKIIEGRLERVGDPLIKTMFHKFVVSALAGFVAKRGGSARLVLEICARLLERARSRHRGIYLSHVRYSLPGVPAPEPIDIADVVASCDKITMKTGGMSTFIEGPVRRPMRFPEPAVPKVYVAKETFDSSGDKQDDDFLYL
jgi:hypothetical protein